MTIQQSIDIDSWPVVIVIHDKPTLPLFITADYNPAEIADIAGVQELEAMELQLQHALAVVQQAQGHQHLAIVQQDSAGEEVKEQQLDRARLFIQRGYEE